MFGNKKDDERFKNLIFFKVFATNDELEEMLSPGVLIILLIVILALITYFVFR